MFQPGGPTLLELTRQALCSTEAGYDRLAPKFDLTPFRTPDPLIAESVRALTATGPVGAALDVCCGTGAAIGHLRPAVRERVVGVDFSRGMLDEARRQTAGAAGDSALEWVRADVLEMPFDGAFDLAVCFGALGHIRDADGPRFFSGVARVLAPGGRFAFPTYERPSGLSPAYWLARGFNAAMHVRNALVRPPFIMYYLRYMLPEVLPALERAGLTPAILSPYSPPFDSLRLVVATRKPVIGRPL